MELLAIETVDDQACPGCGLPLHQTTDESYPYYYRVDSLECIPCGEKAEWIKEQFGKEGAPAGTYVTVTEGDRVPDGGE